MPPPPLPLATLPTPPHYTGHRAFTADQYMSVRVGRPLPPRVTYRRLITRSLANVLEYEIVDCSFSNVLAGTLLESLTKT